jgi:hypothetical protein
VIIFKEQGQSQWPSLFLFSREYFYRCRMKSIFESRSGWEGKMSASYLLLCSMGLFLVFALIMLFNSIHIVPEFKRLVVFRLGRVLGRAFGPGIVMLLPTLDRAISVDLREQKKEIVDEKATTKDTLPLLFSLRWAYKVIDPIKAVVAVGNFEMATAGVIITQFRKLVRKIDSRELPVKHEQILTELRTGLDEIEGWGVAVTSFEIIKLAVDEHAQEIDAARFTAGTYGETQTTVHTTGTVLIGDQPWEAISDRPIAPKTKVRVKRVLLEVEEATP